MGKMRGIAGVEDVSLKQVFNYPSLFINVDRLRAAEVGLTQADVANSMLVSLSSNALVSPSYFLNPENNVNYTVAVKTPLEPALAGRRSAFDAADHNRQHSRKPAADRANRSVSAEPPAAPAQRLGNISTLTSSDILDSVNHSSVQRVVERHGDRGGPGSGVGGAAKSGRRSRASVP